MLYAHNLLKDSIDLSFLPFFVGEEISVLSVLDYYRSASFQRIKEYAKKESKVVCQTTLPKESNAETHVLKSCIT